ncbi:MAG: C39 family peptidase [Nitrospira sp.]|nr:C39 family peptidase [Nitrospira sp.]
MKTNIPGILGLCIALCLAFTLACVRVEVSVTSPNASTQRPYPDSSWISLAELKEIHKKRLSGNKCPLSRYRLTNGEKQETEAWCWAASTRLAMAFHNKEQSKETDPQCNIVTKTLALSQDKVKCCTGTIPGQCVQGGWPHWVFRSYHFDYKTVGGTLDDWDAVVGEICSTGPFISVIDWTGGGSHTLVVTGYSEDEKESTKVVTVYDPFTDDFQDLSLEEFMGDSAYESDGFYGFSHNRHYVQIAPKTKDHP